MKKFYSFVLLAVTLLLSTNIWAGNVAKVTNTEAGTQVGEYATMTEALTAWTDGTTLTLLEDATYAGDQTYTIDGTRTLDLGGKSLRWQCASNDEACKAAILVTGNVTMKSGNINAIIQTIYNYSDFVRVEGDVNNATLNIDGVLIIADFTAAESRGNIVHARGAEHQSNLSLFNTQLVMKGKCQRGIYTELLTNIVRCENVTIGVLDNTFVASHIYGMSLARKISSEPFINLINVRVDLSEINSSIQTYPIQFSYSKDYSQISTISSGTFVCNSNAKSQPINLYQNGVTVRIDGGKFSKQPTKGSGTLSIPDGKMFAKIGDFYELVSTGIAGLVEENPYTTFEELWNACPDNKQTSVVLLNDGKQDQITIPANKNILLSIGLPEQEYNITNNGSVTLNSTLHGSFINAGAGTLSVIGGTFAETEYNAFVKNNVSAGYAAYLTTLNASSKSYAVWKDGSYSAIVGNEESGYVAYSKLEDALFASTENMPAMVMRDCKLTLSSEFLKISDGKKHIVKLNGKTVNINPGFVLSKGNLTFDGEGVLKGPGGALLPIELQGSKSTTAANYSVLTIGKDVTIELDAEKYGISVGTTSGSEGYPYGIVVNFNGQYNGKCPFYVNGTVVQQGDNMPTFNIGEDATFTCSDAFAYASGYAIWNYKGTATAQNFGIEVRAGKFTMNGGSIVCNSGAPADDQFNGNGSTAHACAVAACQHDTKLPVSVVINGGELKAYTPIYQANPQNNPQEAIDQVSVVVNNDAKVYSTSKNIVWSANKKVVLNGGVYNQNPSVYAAAGKVAVANTAAATKDKYPWTIGAVKAGITFNGTTDAEWSNAANWSGNAVATAETPAIINADVIISGKAEAYGITVESGKKITIQKGGVLMVGKNGISGITSADQLIIEDGGALLISPAATNNQPYGKLCKKLETYKKDVSQKPLEEGESPYVRLHIGIPTTAQPTISNRILVSSWNTVTGWEDASEFATAFKGYDITTATIPAEATQFGGTLVGNTDATLNMSRTGFHFFANSWSAPIDTRELLNQLNALKLKGKVEVSIKTHNSDDTFNDINMGTVENNPSYAEIAPMTGFFLFANEATPSLFLTYEKAVWNAQLATKQAAPKRVMVAETDKNAVRIKLMAANGRQDNVYIYDGEEFHSTKMMNAVPNVNIYVEGEGNYSTFASEDLEGTMIAIQTNSQTNYSLSFDFVKGETLYIKDLQTNVVTAMTEGNVYNFTATANETSRRFIISRHNTTTSVDNIDVNTAAKGVYSITGQYLGESNIVETLPQGIYVVDGRKVIK